MRPPAPLAVTATLLAALVPGAAASERPAGPGPAVGERIPSFRATDQDGRERDLASLRGPEGLVLVFFRSADW